MNDFFFSRLWDVISVQTEHTCCILESLDESSRSPANWGVRQAFIFLSSPRHECSYGVCIGVGDVLEIHFIVIIIMRSGVMPLKCNCVFVRVAFKWNFQNTFVLLQYDPTERWWNIISFPSLLLHAVLLCAISNNTLLKVCSYHMVLQYFDAWCLVVWFSAVLLCCSLPWSHHQKQHC